MSDKSNVLRISLMCDLRIYDSNHFKKVKLVIYMLKYENQILCIY
jgi:hypothetical protein